MQTTPAAMNRARQLAIGSSLPGAPEAVALIEAAELAAVANHSVRVYLYAVLIAERQGLAATTDYDAAMLLHACLLHDIGTSDRYDGPLRFEVEGANAAHGWLEAYGYDLSQRDQVWEAIALHTSPQIAELRGPITRLTRLGVRTDFGDDILPSSVRAEIEQEFPRLDIERALSGAVLAQALRNPAKAPANSWAGRLLAAHSMRPDDPDAVLAAF